MTAGDEWADVQALVGPEPVPMRITPTALADGPTVTITPPGRTEQMVGDRRYRRYLTMQVRATAQRSALEDTDYGCGCPTCVRARLAGQRRGHRRRGDPVTP